MTYSNRWLNRAITAIMARPRMFRIIEQIYSARFSVWAQNLAISAYGTYWKNMRLGGKYQDHVKGFRERDRWSKEQMDHYTQTALRKVLLHAFDSVPFYRDSWQKIGIRRSELEQFTYDDLNRLPITRKLDLRTSSEQFIAIDVASREKIFRYNTSGSTGTPIAIAITKEDHRRALAAREARSFGWAGASIQMKRSMIGGRQIIPRMFSVPPFHRLNWSEQQIYFPAYHISPDHVMDFVSGLNEFRPEVLTGYSYSHFILAKMMLDHKVTLDFEPVAAILGSEKLTPEMKQVIGESFRTRAYEEYGCVENCILATECEHGSLHLHSDFGLAEILDAEGRRVKDGEEGRIVCTSLTREAQPLIRYEIGDLGIFSEKQCPCGRDQLPVLKEITGRIEDMITGKDGSEMVRFVGLFYGLDSVIEGQVVQEDVEKFTINVVAGKGFGQTERETILKRFANDRLGPVSVSIDIVREIPRTERGKFRLIHNKIPKDRREALRRAHELRRRGK
jgi:phenylacetate-CoA ligase